ncbi:MAG: DUF4394 domain-containing protein [Alphaproteobacteria bacterium]
MNLSAAQAATAYALTGDNKLVTFDTDTRKAAKTVAVKGTDGALLGIDVRPNDGKLYGITGSGAIYTIDAGTGAATKVSQLDKKFDHGGRALVDFNPQADRLRLIGLNGTSLRVDVDKGAVTVDGSLKYGEKDANATKKATVTMGAYTNSMPKAKGTELFNIDTTLGTLVLQSPPNDGVLQTRGPTGVKFGPKASMDIFLNANDDNIAYVLDGGTLHMIDLKTGKATKAGKVAATATAIDFAIQPVKK